MHNHKGAQMRSIAKAKSAGCGHPFRLIMVAKRVAICAVAGLLVFAGAAGAQTAPIGDVEFVRGAGAAQRPGEAARVLGAGSKVEQGEVLTTGTTGFAVVKLNDGTRMTLRPNSAMKIDEFVMGQAGKSDNMVMHLLKGGLRLLTGSITKQSSSSRLYTSTATVGIRGTDFDARICAEDCKVEGRRPVPLTAQASASALVQASARVLQLQGGMTAVGENGQQRLVVAGGPAFKGDTLETPAGAQAVLVFRDDTRITIQGGTRIRIDDYAYDGKTPGEGSFSLGLLKGGIRALTGLIGKSQPSRVRFSTSTATVGIRGTGLDMRCGGSGAGETGGGGGVADGCFIATWQGEVTVASIAAPNDVVVVPAGAAASVTPGQAPARLLAEVPAFMRENNAPRPDGIATDLQQLFGGVRQAAPEDGLYVHLRDGHLAIEQGGRTLDIGRGEAAFVDASGRTLVRLDSAPSFILSDPTPRPDRVDARGVQFLNTQSLGMRTRADLVCTP